MARSSIVEGPRSALRRTAPVRTRATTPVGHGAAGLGLALEGVRRRGRPLRVWCAGAGSASEPLTILVLCAAAGVEAEVIATDVDDGAVAALRPGPVPGRLMGLPRGVVGGRLVVDSDGFRASGPLAARLRIARGDVREIPAGGPFDLVVCRDVLHHYRTDVAHATLRGLLAATDDDGVVLITAVDALAAGRPLSGSHDVLLRREPASADGRDSLEAFVDDDDGHPALQLAALLDPGADIPRRAARLLRLADRTPGLEEARLAAGAVALAEGQTALARRLLELPVSVAGEGDASTLLAIAALKDGDHHAARALLARAQPSSWLAPYLMGRLLRRVQREADAQASFRLALTLLEGGGSAPAGSAFLEGCAPEQAAAWCREALRGNRAAWHGP